MPASQKSKSVDKSVDKYAATTWGVDTEDLECPSGQTCLVRRVDIMRLMSDGTLHKTDMLTSLVEKNHVAKKAKGGKNAPRAAQMDNEKMLKDALRDPAKMKELVDTIDSIVLATVVKPEIHPVPDSDEERNVGWIYIDSVDINDKTFIMQYAFGGTRAAARFLEELNESADRLADVESVERPAE
jgi:exosome complex RNA-binding protein Rrp42 (RNase PH superfamily)